MAARCTTPPAAMHHFTGMDAPFARNQCTTFCGHTVLLGRCMQICSACEKDGVPQPEYTINPGDIMIKFTAPEDRVIRSVTGRVTEKVTDKVTDTLDETSLKILNLLAVDPAYTTTFLSENLSLSRKTVSLRLKMLKENGLIERVGSDRKGYWKLLK